LKSLAMPKETRTAPVDFPSMQSRKSSCDSRFECALIVKQVASSALEMPSAISPAPGLQKQPVRSDIPRVVGVELRLQVE
jgi:hypothetical protein